MLKSPISIDSYSIELKFIICAIMVYYSFHFEQILFRSMHRLLSYQHANNADGWTDRQTDGFSALYSRLASVPALPCWCMTYAYLNCYVSYVFYSYSYMPTCSLLWLPVIYYDYL